MTTQWSARRRRYIQNGRAVPEKKVRAGVQSAIEQSKKRVNDVSQQLIDGKISVAEWTTTMRDEIRAAHRAAMMIAQGGKLNASTSGKLGATVRGQYKYLTALTNALENGDTPLDGRIRVRAQMYIQAAYSTHQNGVKLREQDAGMALGRWVIGVARHHCEGCLDEERRGWVPISTIPPIGSHQCVTNCRCYIEFKQSRARGTGGDG